LSLGKTLKRKLAIGWLKPIIAGLSKMPGDWKRLPLGAESLKIAFVKLNNHYAYRRARGSGAGVSLPVLPVS
jgi:hypothetical protein